MQSIVHPHLQYRKVCAQLIPKRLIPAHKKQRIGLSLQHLINFYKYQVFVKCIIEGYESCPLYIPESKRISMEWKHTLFSLPKISKSMPAARKRT
ncbi:hypothetical protein NPIL_649481 [Nephila pilipes]|uniref:Uncharacterized protein n=1 Tax=Nephila pilipes TaxID=299642 RepID=A0A8X6PQ78_NEPPI|nr:hypothetical protein NPIL_649481 [Nephila pilipes]